MLSTVHWKVMSLSQWFPTARNDNVFMRATSSRAYCVGLELGLGWPKAMLKTHLSPFESELGPAAYAGYLVWEGCYGGWVLQLNFFCQKVPSKNPSQRHDMHGTWTGEGPDGPDAAMLQDSNRNGCSWLVCEITAFLCFFQLTRFFFQELQTSIASSLAKAKAGYIWRPWQSETMWNIAKRCELRRLPGPNLNQTS